MSQNKIAERNIIVTAIPAFSDNYIWAITNTTSENLVLVDPGDAQVCIDYITANNKILTEILVTHHHSDHVGGLAALKAYCQKNKWPLTVYYPENKNIVEGDITVNETSIIDLASLNCQFSVIELPGHTLDHIAYLTEQQLFCGDTLFSGGCGRLFEGTPAQMHHSLSKLSALPETTQIYCAHEYTQTNLNFALAVEPTNLELINYYNQVQELRDNKQITLPSSIGLEKSINPFLRCHVAEVIESASLYKEMPLNSPTETFAAVRNWKDNF